mgnify:FL=1
MKCPSCKEEISESADKKFKPFCSERCRSLDLSDWLNERNVIFSDLSHSED